jgi:FMN phosphatase YigB (HAD superfamily)
VRSVDPDFLRICLTTDEKDPVRFAQLVGNNFGITVTPEMVAAFLKVINEESMCSGIFFDAKSALKVLKARGYKLVLASNLWPFPVECLFQEDNLGKFFPEKLRVYSFRENVEKPVDLFFDKALVRAESPAHCCLMIGDHLENDILPARRKSIRTCLIDRNGKYLQPGEGEQSELPFLSSRPTLQSVPADVIRIASMMDLLTFLPDRTQLQARLGLDGAFMP